MIVVWINKRNWKHPGPILNMVAHNAHSFAALGFETHLVTGEGEPSDTTDDLRDFYGLDHPASLHVHRVARARNPWLGASRPLYRHAARLIDSLARRDRVAVFTREAGMLPMLARLSSRSGVCGIYELHDLHASTAWREGKVPSRVRREKWMERLFLPRVSGLLSITRRQSRFYRKLFPRPAHAAVPLGVKPFPENDAEARRLARTIFYVGHMQAYKGVAFLKEIAPLLAARRIRMEFWGGTKEVESFRRKHRKSGLADWLEAQPFQPPKVMHEAMAARGSLGTAMLEDTFYNRNLTCPVKVLDYLAHGMPVLASPVPSITDLIGDAGIYLPHGDAPAFIDAAASLLDDEHAYAAAVARVRRCAERLLWTRRAEALAGFAAECFARKA